MTEDLRCSFCNKNFTQVKKLIKGVDAYICNECVEYFTVTPDKTQQSFDDDRLKCSFCGRLQKNSNDIFYSKNDAKICYECLDLCRQIIE